MKAVAGTRVAMTKRSASQKQLIDGVRLRADLAAIHARHGRGDADLRAAVLARIKEALAHGRAVAESRLQADGRGTRCAVNLAYVQDEIIRTLCDFTIERIYTARNPSVAERLCVVAVGGYGRGTLAPGSDTDLLFVLPYKQTPWGESVVEYMLYILWDLGLKVGHATRSVDECI